MAVYDGVMTGLVGLILFHLHDSVRGYTMYWSSSVILAWHRFIRFVGSIPKAMIKVQYCS